MTPSVMAEAPPTLGLRERHKLDKQNRITSAATALFARDGYDGTTLRDIAREADVALGTLSLYARDKRDLVLMIFNAIIPPLIRAGNDNVEADVGLVDNLIRFFAPFYRTYREEVRLYRVVLGQIYNGSESVHAEANDRVRFELLDMLGNVVRMAQEAGECRRDLDIGVHARIFFYLYFTAVRAWLFEDDPDAEVGIAELRRLFEAHRPAMVKRSRPRSVAAKA